MHSPDQLEQSDTAYPTDWTGDIVEVTEWPETGTSLTSFFVHFLQPRHCRRCQALPRPTRE